MNGTLRERVKVQRGWKKYKTPLAEGQRIAYNFVKPHQALDGQDSCRGSRSASKRMERIVGNGYYKTNLIY